ncbi:MAG TPA: hypothetical protein VN844_02475 [Pyrinomonadaceae bacterium]|nr:hypothetical protein [Pyrinomonadaceae bacterium]
MTKRNKLILLALPTLVVILVLVVILNWHVSTRVRISLTTDKLVLRLAGQEKARILDSVGLKSLVIEKFESIKLNPESLSVGNLEPGSTKRAGTELTIAQRPIVITPRDGRTQSNVTFEADPTLPKSAIMIDSINAQPQSEVSLETTEELTDLILRIDGQRSSGHIGINDRFNLDVDHTSIAGVATRQKESRPATSLSGKLVRASPLEFVSQQDSLVLVLTFPAETSSVLVPQGHLPISLIKFETLDGQSGNTLSSLTKDTEAEISFPDYGQKFTKVVVKKPDFIFLDNLENFSVEELTFNPGKKGILVRLNGVANRISSGSKGYIKDHRLSVYDMIWNDHKVIAIFAVFCWMLGTTGACYKLFKEA